METVIPWGRLYALLDPHYPKFGGRGRPPMPLESIFRIYCLQQWFSFSDRQMEDALYEIESARCFAGFSGVTERLPEETTILNFRRLLERRALTAQIFAEINRPLKEQGLLVSKGSMVEATIIHAASSTKNKAGARDPEMPQTRQGKQWYLGVQIHADVDSGAAHHVTVTAANTAGIS